MAFYRGGIVVFFTTKRKKEEKRKHDHRTKTEQKSVYIIYNFFYFMGAAWYNVDINAGCAKLAKTCKKYLKSAWKSAKKRQKGKIYKNIVKC